MFGKFIDIVGCFAGGMMIWNFFPKLDTTSGIIYFALGVFFLVNSMWRIMHYKR